MADIRSEPTSGIMSAPVLNGVPLKLMTEAELLDAMRLEKAPRSFRAWCRDIGIRPVPGRRGVYDPRLVRERLDEAQGLKAPATTPATTDAPPLSLVEQRRVRRGRHQG